MCVITRIPSYLVCIMLTSVFISSSQVLRSMRLTIKATCPMNLANFPMDDQMCTVSFALAKKDLFWWSHWTKFSSFTQMYYQLYFFVCWVVSLLPAWPQYKSFQDNCVSSYLNLQAICILNGTFDCCPNLSLIYKAIQPLIRYVIDIDCFAALYG